MKRTALLWGLHPVIALVFSTGCFSAAPGSDEGVPGFKDASAARCLTPEDASRLEDQVFQLVNLERAEAGLPPVVIDPALQKIAADYACRMIDDGFFGHRNPTSGYGPGERAMIGKYSFFAVGENLAAGQETTADVMRVWMESPSHKAIILDERWSELGMAVRLGGRYSIYWVQVFGDPTDY